MNIPRNLSTPESRAFWKRAEECAAEVATWPDWRRAGINVVTERPVVHVDLDEYRRDPARYERLASETTRVIVQRPSGEVYATIGGRSVCASEDACD